MRQLAVIFSLLTALICMSPVIVFAQNTQINVHINTTQTRPAWLALPDDYNATSIQYALVIFLHGAGEAGSNMNVLISGSSAHGPSYFVQQNLWPAVGFTNPTDGQKYKFIVVSPLASNYSISNTQLPYVIADLVANYRVNVDRIYLTGLSAGGDGLTMYSAHVGVGSPTYKAAAIVPMSAANGNPQTNPTWATTIVADSIRAWGFGSVCCDAFGTYEQTLMNQMNAAKAGIARFTDYAGGHCCWRQFYDPTYHETIGGVSMNIYEWMLQYSRAAGGPGANQPPVVNITTADQILTLPTNSVTGVTSTSSDVSPGTITARAWTQVSGPNTATISAPSSGTTNITGMIAGSYQFRLTVTDNDGATASDLINIQVNPLSGGGTTKTMNINLYGNSDPYNTTGWNDWNVASSLTKTGLTWSDGSSSPLTLVLSTQTSYADNTATYPTTPIMPDRVGRYMSYFAGSRTLQVSGLDASKTYKYTLLSSRAGRTDTTVFLIGGTSIKIFHGNNSTMAAVFPNVFPASNGTTTINIQSISGSTNYLNALSIEETTPSGGGADSPPVANAGQDQTITLPVSSTTVNAGGSTDDGTIVNYAWSKISGPGTPVIVGFNNQITQITGLQAGTYVYRVAVTDDASQTTTDDLTITVVAATNTAPNANGGGNKTVLLPASSTTLDGTASSDVESSITYHWETIFAPVAPGGTPPNATYAIPGGIPFNKNPDGQSHLVITTQGTMHGGDTIYLRGGYYASVAIENVHGDSLNYLVVCNYPGESVIVGDSLWSGGAWAQGLIFRNCHFIEVVAVGTKDNFKIIGSNSDIIVGSAPARTAYTTLGMSQLSYGFACHNLTIRHGGAGIFAKTEVLAGDPNTWYPNALPKWRFHDITIYNTYNEAMYIGHTAAYWNINTNSPFYPGPSDPTPDPAIYKRPTKLQDVKIYNITIDSIGNDAIQTAAIDTLEVYNNTITRWGLKHGFSDNGGVVIGGYVRDFHLHDNILHDGWGEFFQIYAEGGGALIENNLCYRNQLDGVSIRGSTGLLITFRKNTIAYIGGHAIRVNGFFGGTGHNIIEKNILAQPGMTQSGTYTYLENGGQITEGSSPNDNKKFTTGVSVDWNEADFFKPNVTSTAVGYGFLPSEQGSVGYVHTIVSPNSSTTSVTGLIQGVYIIRLTVTDTGGLTDTDDLTITVNNSNPIRMKLPKFGRIKMTKP